MNEMEITTAFHALAEHGPMDEQGAWERIQARAEADRRSGARRRTVFTVAALAAAGSAAATLLVVVDDDAAREAIEVGPAGTGETSTTATSSSPTQATTSTTATTSPPPTAVPPPDGPILFPSVPVAAVVDGEVQILDGETGDIVGIAGVVTPGHTITALDVAGARVAWEETDDASGSTSVFLLVSGGLEANVLAGASAPALSESMALAYAVNTTDEGNSIEILDFSEGGFTRLDYGRHPELDDPRTLDLDWAPDGRLLITAMVDGVGTWLGSPFTQTFDEFEQLSFVTEEGGPVEPFEIAVSDSGHLLLLGRCCFPWYDPADVPADEEPSGVIDTGTVRVAELVPGASTTVATAVPTAARDSRPVWVATDSFVGGTLVVYADGSTLQVGDGILPVGPEGRIQLLAR